MIISINWLKKFTAIDLPINELTDLIGARLVEIEQVIDLNAKYKDVVIAKIVEASKLEGSDHLNVTKLDDGGVTPDVERDENGLVQVVCGAPNVRPGLFIAWLPPRATVPNTFSDAEPFVLAAKKLRGVMSNGMIASARELDLYDEHDGILELDDNLEAGTSFAKQYELDDYLLDIENKSLTHRPDCFGIIGFAREIAAISGKAFTTPKWLSELTPTFGVGESTMTPPTVMIDDEQLSDRYEAIVLAGARAGAASPLLVQTYLGRVGVRPISAVVDVTNYLMMLTGQPLHAFDYDKLIAVGGGTAAIHVRAARGGETLQLLDGRTVQLAPEDIVIASGNTAVALAGAMGGAETEIDASTKSIIIESATFNLYKLRATQMRHGIFSEAITRFTKGQPAELTAPVLKKAVDLLGEYADARAVTPAIEAYPGKREPQTLLLAVDTLNDTLGSKFSTEDITETLDNVEFTTGLVEPRVVQIAAPYWRADIHIQEDIIEEVGRLNGFDTIEPTLPKRDFVAVRPQRFDEFRSRVRGALVRAGASEVLSYSFVHGDVLTRAGQRLEDSYRITNSISPDLQYYRQSLTPNLLSIIHPNVKQGFEDFAVFELNKTHPKQRGFTSENVPEEANMVAFVIAHKKPGAGAAFYQAKRALDYLAATFGLELYYDAISVQPDDPTAAPFEYRRSALVRDAASNKLLGIVGEYKKSVTKGFKLPEYCAGFELDINALFEVLQGGRQNYVPLSRYPSAERDICFQVDLGVTYQDVVDAAHTAITELPLEVTIVPLDLYQAEGSTTKNVTLRVTLTSHERTLASGEITEIMQTLSGGVSTAVRAIVI